MPIKPVCLLRPFAAASWATKKEDRPPSYLSGERIVWNTVTLQITYEDAGGMLLGELVLAGMDSENGHMVVELPRPSSTEEARLLAFAIASAKSLLIRELHKDHRLFMWEIE